MPESPTMFPLQIQGLCKRLGSFELKDVDLDIPVGAITGLVGANGAGKSTLFKLVLGLMEADGGSIHLFGENIHQHGPSLRSRIGFVQESPTLPVLLRIGDLGDMVAPFYPTWDRVEFQRLVDFFGIPRKTPFRKLSQGNRMKAAIVLALAHRPELLLLDEPTSGLDPLARRELLELLLEVVQDEGRAVFFSTHITSDLDRVADHIAMMKAGRIVLSGTKDELLERWTLVKGGEELLTQLDGRIHGGQRTELGVELLCESNVKPPSGALTQQLRLEDLVYFYERPIDAGTEVETCSH